jgi:hypothetical protein
MAARNNRDTAHHLLSSIAISQIKFFRHKTLLYFDIRESIDVKFPDFVAAGYYLL